MVTQVRKATVGNSIAKAIFLYLAECYNPKAGCYPAQSNIAKVLELSPQSVRRGIVYLEKRGFIGRRVQQNGSKIERTFYDLYATPQAVTQPAPQIATPQADTAPQVGATCPTGSTYKKRNRNVKKNDTPAKENEPPKVKTTKAPKGIEAIRSVCSIYPPKVGWDVLLEAVSDDPDIEKLTTCFKAWSLKGNKPTNYAWVTAWYVNGIPEYAQSKQLKAPNGYDPKKDIMHADYEMSSARTSYPDAADYYFSSDHNDGTREKYERFKTNWLETSWAKGYEYEIEEYERTYRFRKRFGEAGQNGIGASVDAGGGLEH